MLDEPWGPDTLEETVARGFAVLVNMFSAKGGRPLTPNNFRAIPRVARPTKPEEMPVAELIALGGDDARR